MALEDIYAYFRSYDQDSFEVVACQGQEPSEADVATFELQCGFRLPDEFRRFTMSPLGGLYMEAKEELWPRAEDHQVGPSWSFLRGLKVFGIAEEIPDWLDIRAQYEAMKDVGYPTLVPFLQVEGDANCYCFDARGRIVLWDHEQPDEQREEVISFPDLMLREIRALEERTERKRQGDAQTHAT